MSDAIQKGKRKKKNYARAALEGTRLDRNMSGRNERGPSGILRVKGYFVLIMGIPEFIGRRFSFFRFCHLNNKLCSIVKKLHV